MHSNSTRSPFLDGVLRKSTAAFYKLGMHLDSSVKVLAVAGLSRLLAVSLLVLDKFSVIFMTKKNTESLWEVISAPLSKYKRDHFNVFKLFWYSTALLALVFVVV